MHFIIFQHIFFSDLYKLYKYNNEMTKLIYISNKAFTSFCYKDVSLVFHKSIAFFENMVLFLNRLVKEDAILYLNGPIEI